jgi:hypothetical protein
VSDTYVCNRRAVTEASLKDLFLLAECDYFVGSFSSGNNTFPPQVTIATHIVLG